jgi:hypothetical protein
VAIDYTTKWVEAKALRDNIAQNIAKFIYENIIICFGCLTHLVSDQGTHLINRTCHILILPVEILKSHIINQLPTIHKETIKLSP